MKIVFILRPYAIFPALSTLVILLSVIFFILRGKRTLLLVSFISLQLIILLWSMGQLIGCVCSGYKMLLLSVIMIHTSISFFASFWTIFCFAYTGKLKKRCLLTIIIILIPAVFSYIIFLTNPLHNMYLTHLSYDSYKVIDISYGDLFWITSVLSPISNFIGLIILIKHFFTVSGSERYQTLLVIFAPVITNIISTLTAQSIKSNVKNSLELFDFTPFSFIVIMIIFSIAAYKYRFMEISSAALLKVVENIKEPVMIFDNTGAIKKYNTAFSNEIGKYTDLNHPYSTEQGFFSKLNTFVIKNKKTYVTGDYLSDLYNCKNINVEITVMFDTLRTYRINSITITEKKETRPWKIVTFNDITEYIELMGQLNDKSCELEKINQEVTGHLNVIEELTSANERNRIARKLHDNLGNNLTFIIMMMKECRKKVNADIEAVSNLLDEGIRVAQEGLTELRWTVKGLEENVTIEQGIERIVNDFQNTAVKIDLLITGEKENSNIKNSIKYFKISDSIYRICREAVTNSIKHGSATKIAIYLNFEKNMIILGITDNGKADMEISEGFGLGSISESVAELGGTLIYGTDKQSGFIINIKLPLEITNSIP